MHVAEAFINSDGLYVNLKTAYSMFRKILNCLHDVG